MRFGDELGNETVLDLEGAATPLRSLWANKTLVLVFIRHFG
jgi:hypothetical protein